MWFISAALAQDIDLTQSAAQAPSTSEAFIWNMAMILVLVALFYVLMIRPQQKRFKEHAAMLSSLKKGDKVVTSGGLIGKIDKIKDGDDEVVVDLGSSVKVKAVLSTLSKKEDKNETK